MTDAIIQTAFHAGEWAPALYGRVDLAKYKAGAALLRNFFVDYRGGASSRMGTKYVLHAYKSSTAVRLIRFQDTFTVGYILEFGDGYIRPFYQGAPIVTLDTTITGVTQANPAVVSVVNSYTVNDTVYITGVSGMTQLNGNYYTVIARTAGTVTLGDLSGNAIDSSAYGAWTAGGLMQVVYTIHSPFAAADLPLVKFAQNGNVLILTHPNYAPQALRFSSPTDWIIATLGFGATIEPPTSVTIGSSSLPAGSVNYSYTVSAVDANGQESAATSIASLPNVADFATTRGTTRIGWLAPTGVTPAVSYNVYKAEPVYNNSVPAGAAFGYIGNCTGLTFDDTGISPDFSFTVQIPENPFSGAGVSSITLTGAGTSYFTVPVVTVAAPGGTGTTATAQAFMIAYQIDLVDVGGFYAANDTITLPNGILLKVLTTDDTGLPPGKIVTFSVTSYGDATSAIPPNALLPIGTSGSGSGSSFNATWKVSYIGVVSPGSGYGAAPAVTFSTGAATATAVLGASSAGNPSVCGLYQQRVVFAGPPGSPGTFYMSQPGFGTNFNVSNPIQADDAITSTITSGQLNDIKSMVPMPTGLLMFTSNVLWQINGGSAGAAVTPSSIVANAHSYIGASDVPPIVANFDVLYVQSKGSIVRNLSYNFYANIFTGTDISVLSSHLFYGYQINEWAWAEEPHKVVWCVRNDGQLLSLTYLKEQELIGWAHSDTNGAFESVATVTETIPQGAVDAVYFVVQRTVNGQSVKYIERMADRYLTSYTDPTVWCVDAGLQYSGTAATHFTGGQHLAGMTVTGLADGVVITPFTMAANGEFTLANAASVVTVGLAFTPQLTTLPLDTGDPTIQGKRKGVDGVVVRCQNTLQLKIGSASLVPMKDTYIGNVGTMSNQRLAGFLTGDARTIVDPSWNPYGQYTIQQDFPYPATILAVVPEIQVGDK